MALKFVLFAACVAFARGGILPQSLTYAQFAAPYAQVQYQQGIAAPNAYAQAFGRPLTSVYRVDHPLGAQISSAPIPRYAPIDRYAPIPAPFGPAQIARFAPAQIAPAQFAHFTPAQVSHFSTAQIATPIAARIAPIPTPLVHSIAPAAHLGKAVVAEEYDPNPQYTFSYDVQDALTGDNKNQIESRNGDVVQGSYSLNDPDGTRRTVEYTADPVNGFNAVVHKEPLVAKAVVAQSIGKVHAPIGYSPIAQSALALSAPIIH